MAGAITPLGSFTGVAAGTAVRIAGGDVPSLVVVTGGAGTINLDVSVDGGATWARYQNTIGADLAINADQAHPIINCYATHVRANCTIFGSGTLTVWLVSRD